MGSHFAFLVIFAVLMFSVTLEARPDPGTTQNLAHKKADCSKSSNNGLIENQNFVKIGNKNLFVEDFEPRPNVSAYNDDSKIPKEGKAFVRDFEPRTGVKTYSDDAGLKEEKAFVRDFEPRPNVSVYKD